jgi:hypothetical protein
MRVKCAVAWRVLDPTDVRSFFAFAAAVCAENGRTGPREPVEWQAGEVCSSGQIPS